MENIRMLFDFMQELNYRYRLGQEGKVGYTGYVGIGGLKQRNEILKSIRETIIESTNGCLTTNIENYDAPFLYQNPLSTYLAFYLELFHEDGAVADLAKTVDSELAPMLNYFNILQYLTEEEFAWEKEKPDHHASIPYIYEDLCLSIREMTRCNACYLLYQEKGEMAELISRSGYVADGETGLLANFNIKVSELDSIIGQISSLTEPKYSVVDQSGATFELKYSEPSEIAEGIKAIMCSSTQIEAAQDSIIATANEKTRETAVGSSETPSKISLTSKTTTHKYLVFELLYFREETHDKNDRAFYVLLDYPIKDTSSHVSSNDCKKFALKVLFLRNRLWEALRNDYAELIDYRFDCSYIKSVEENSDNCLIMHISDVHLQDDDSWSPEGYICKKLCEHIGSLKISFDLLAITGDIINASQNAFEAQAKYYRAGLFLQKIATELWSIKDENASVSILPHDWKRRVLIVTGNHDYTAMNELIVETGARKIKSALPTKHSGGTMSKFTYYIEFLVNFLDAPVDELLENDLNEIRDYKYLHLKVALVNTSSKANSLQTNKVRIDEETIIRLINRTHWLEENEQQKHVILMHHAPTYKINYFDDRYSAHNLISKDYIQQQEYDDYISLLTKHIADVHSLDQSSFVTVWSADEAKQLDSLRKLLASKKNLSFTKSELWSDIEDFIRIVDKRMRHDEFDYNFAANVKSIASIQMQDQEAFESICGKLIGALNVIVLAGHEHKAKHSSIGINNSPVYIAPELFSNNMFNYFQLYPNKPDIVDVSIPIEQNKVKEKEA